MFISQEGQRVKDGNMAKSVQSGDDPDLSRCVSQLLWTSSSGVVSPKKAISTVRIYYSF